MLAQRRVSARLRPQLVPPWPHQLVVSASARERGQSRCKSQLAWGALNAVMRVPHMITWATQARTKGQKGARWIVRLISWLLVRGVSFACLPKHVLRCPQHPLDRFPGAHRRTSFKHHETQEHARSESDFGVMRSGGLCGRRSIFGPESVGEETGCAHRPRCGQLVRVQRMESMCQHKLAGRSLQVRFVFATLRSQLGLDWHFDEAWALVTLAFGVVERASFRSFQVVCGPAALVLMLANTSVGSLISCYIRSGWKQLVHLERRLGHDTDYCHPCHTELDWRFRQRG